MKKSLSILLAFLLLITLFAGCQSSPAPAETSTDTPATTTPAEDSTNNPTEGSADTPADDSKPTGETSVMMTQSGINVNDPTVVPGYNPDDPYRGLQLPLTTEDVEFTCFQSTPSAITIHNYDKTEDVPAFLEAEAATGVHVAFTSVADFATQFPLMVASEDYTDAFTAYLGMMTTSLDEYVADDILIDLTDIILENCPNYMHVRTSDDDVARRTLNDSNQLLAFYNIKKTLQPSWVGLVTIDKWLTEYGQPIETYDEYKDYLLWVKDNYNPSMPYVPAANGMENYLMAGYGICSSWSLLDGKVVFGPATQNFKDYVYMMKDWYDSGLFHANFFGETRFMSAEYAEIVNYEMGMFGTAYTFMPVTEGVSDDPNFQLKAITCPVINNGDKRNIDVSGGVNTRFESGLAAIFSSCEDPVLLAKWFDYFFTPEGSMLCSFGVEGGSYNLDENGKPVFVDYVQHNPDHLAPIQAWGKWTADGIPHEYDWTREINDSLVGSGAEAQAIWDSNWVDTNTFPSITRTKDEADEYSSIMSDIDTRVAETVVKFIIGTNPIEEWDAFVEELYSMDLQTAIDIQQAAYDRFMARGQ